MNKSDIGKLVELVLVIIMVMFCSVGLVLALWWTWHGELLAAVLAMAFVIHGRMVIQAWRSQNSRDEMRSLFKS